MGCQRGGGRARPVTRIPKEASEVSIDARRSNLYSYKYIYRISYLYRICSKGSASLRGLRGCRGGGARDCVEIRFERPALSIDLLAK